MEKLKKILKARETGSLLFLILIIIIVGIINPAFWQAQTLFNVLNDSVVFTLLAVGIGFVILTGEIDVSIGAVLGISAAIGSTMLRNGANIWSATAAALLSGAAIGIVNGIGTSCLHIPSLIFTLGTNGVVRGLIYVYTNGAWVENLPASFTKASNIKLLGDLTVFYAFTIIIVFSINLITIKTRQGKYFRAVGDNIAGANLVGIPTTWTKILAYTLCSIFAAAAGMVYSSRIGFITPMAGNGYEMKAIAACVIGGIALTGGQGSLMGAAIGAIIMSSISRILVFLKFSSDYDNTITGVMLIVIVVVTTHAQNKAIIKNRREILLARVSALGQKQNQIIGGKSE